MPRPPIADPGERQRRFEVVYAAHRGPVLGYVLRRTGNPDDAADVIAETFLTAWRRLDEIPRDPQTRLWLYGVARRVLANHHRGERRRSALADRLRADLAVGYHPPEFDGEQAQITEAFRGLPAADRDLLALSAWEGLDYGQIVGVRFAGETVARVLAMLRERHVTVPVFNYAQAGDARNLSHVPGTWYVYGADPWAPGQVMLFVGPTRTQPGNHAPQPGTPSPSPTG